MYKINYTNRYQRIVALKQNRKVHHAADRGATVWRTSLYDVTWTTSCSEAWERLCVSVLSDLSLATIDKTDIGNCGTADRSPVSCGARLLFQCHRMAFVYSAHQLQGHTHTYSSFVRIPVRVKRPHVSSVSLQKEEVYDNLFIHRNAYKNKLNLRFVSIVEYTIFFIYTRVPFNVLVYVNINIEYLFPF